MFMVIMGSHLTIQPTLITLEKKIHWNKNFIRNICRIQAYDLIMWGYFYTGFINFMLKRLTCKKPIALFVVIIENSKTLKYNTF